MHPEPGHTHNTSYGFRHFIETRDPIGTCGVCSGVALIMGAFVGKSSDLLFVSLNKFDPLLTSVRSRPRPHAVKRQMVFGDLVTTEAVARTAVSFIQPPIQHAALPPWSHPHRGVLLATGPVDSPYLLEQHEKITDRVGYLRGDV